MCFYISRGGELLTLTGDIVKQWKEHFEELLNPTNTSSVEESSPICGAEVSEVVKKSLGHKVPGVDEIHPEMMKVLDIGPSWMRCLFSVMWKLGTVSVEWQTGMAVTIFKKRDWRVCSNYRVDHTSQFPHESLFQVAEKEALTDCQTSDPGGAMQITLALLLGVLWEFSNPVYMCSVDLKKGLQPCRGVLCGVLWEYGVPGPLLQAIRSSYNQSESSVHIIKVKYIFGECGPLSGLSLVSDSVCDIHGQDLKMQPGRGKCPVLGTQSCVSAICK